MADVFISYKAEDRARVAPLVAALELAGFDVWWDARIGAGSGWRQEIQQELDSARSVVVVWSRRSAGKAGGFVQDEAARAQRRGVYLPVRIDKVEPPLGFGQVQVLSLLGWKGDSDDPRIVELANRIAALSGRAVAGTSSARTARGISRRTVFAGAAAAGIAVLGGGGWVLWNSRQSSGADSIAVLPFENLSGDPAQGHFANGMASEIRNSLSLLAGLKVAGSTSSAAVRSDDAQTVARKLKVANILTGSVRQGESTIRVTAELIDGRTGLSRWSQNYDRAPADIIAVQSDIAEKVARALAITLGSGERRARFAGETGNVTAQTLVFQARDVSYGFTGAAFRQSLQLLEQALRLDPDYARAYAIKAFVLNNLANLAPNPADMARGRGAAMRTAVKALSLAPDLPIARSALAYSHQLDLRVAQSLREHAVAIGLPGGDPDVIRNYGWTRSSIFGALDGLGLVDQAMQLDPLNWASHWAHAEVLFEGRRFDEVVRYSLELRQRAPELFKFEELFGQALLLLDRRREAAAALAGSTTGQALLAARSGEHGAANDRVEEIRRREGDMASYKVALVLSQMGKINSAFAALDQAMAIRLPQLINIRTDPFLDPLRGDPRMNRLIEQIGFPA